MKNNYPAIIGTVNIGKQIARQLGRPTMNLSLPKELSIPYGVYAGFMEYKKIIYKGVMNIGITPNFLVEEPKLEIYVFDFHRKLYGETIKVIPCKYLRPEMKFSNIELLVEQIEKDCAIAMQIMNSIAL